VTHPDKDDILEFISKPQGKIGNNPLLGKPVPPAGGKEWVYRLFT
jgi:hypothetical protein